MNKLSEKQHMGYGEVLYTQLEIYFAIKATSKVENESVTVT